MNRTFWVLLCGILLLVLASGCPRTPKTGDSGTTPPATGAKTDDAASSTSSDPATGNPCAGATDTSNPCGATDAAADPANPCGAAADPANPCAGKAADPTNPCVGKTDASTPPAAGTTIVVFETTKGNIEFEVHPEWSPLGAAHFIELVNAKFYDGAPWFRVLDGFVAQCGVSSNPEMNAMWGQKTIQDEPVVQGNQPGFVAFGKSGMPNSRSTHIFINYGDNTGSLDPQGFSCFAKVSSGMDVAMSLERVEFANQGQLGAPGGMDAFKQMCPKADYINKAYVKK